YMGGKKKFLPKEPIEGVMWDFDDTMYRPRKEMQMAIKQLIYKEVEEKLGVKEAAALYETTKEKTGGNVAALITLHMDPYTYSKIFREVAKEHLKEDKQLVGLFDALKEYDHMLVTNNSTPVVLEACELLGLKPFSEYFLGIIGLETLLPDDYKPSTKPWQKALDAAGMAGTPQRCLAVGDSIEKDILPAKSLGMYTAYVTWGNTDFNQETPHFCAEEVYGMEALLRSIDIVPANPLNEFDEKESAPKHGIEEAVREKHEMEKERKKTKAESEGRRCGL
ncbi:MAG: HAD hydrolase-like protein, partial [Candidatus Aenigmatarchaeota archaeon]